MHIEIFKNASLFMIGAAICFSSYGGFTNPEDVAFKSELDGSRQHYMEMLPESFDKNQKSDLIIGLHGHGSDRKQFASDKRPECRAFREFAAKHNMIAVTPDYRAKTSWMGPAAEADLVQIIKELKTKYNINKVFLVGGSMGATSALTFAAMHPDMIDGVTAMNGHANHLEYNRFQEAISKSFGGAKAEIPMEYKKRSAEYYPERLTMPIACTTGGKDKSVPPVSVKRLVKILQKLNRKVLLINRPATSHSTSFSDGMRAMEFMFTGIDNSSGSENVSDSFSSEAAIVQAEPEPGKGGIFFAQSKAPAEGKGRVDLGLRFYAEKPGKIEALCFYQSKNESGKHTFKLWDTNGQLLLVVNAAAITQEGWIKVPLAKPFAISASTEYILSYTCNKAYPAEAYGLKDNIKRNGFIALEGHYSVKNSGAKAPDKTYKKMNYFIDIIVK